MSGERRRRRAATSSPWPALKGHRAGLIASAAGVAQRPTGADRMTTTREGRSGRPVLSCPRRRPARFFFSAPRKYLTRRASLFSGAKQRRTATLSRYYSAALRASDDDDEMIRGAQALPRPVS